MIRIGLTGSIGSGKSTLAKMASRKINIPVFDADEVVYNLYAADKDLQKFLIKKCGNEIVKNDQVDRKTLTTFMEDESKEGSKWREIEKKIHDCVWVQYDKFVKEHISKGTQHIIADIPLLFEAGYETHFDYTINVVVPYNDQKQRVLKREEPQIIESDFIRRYKSFMPNDQKNQKADFIIDNSGEVAASFLQLRAHIINMKDNNYMKTFNTASVYPGSFDPITLAHVDIIKSASKLPYHKLYVAIGINPKKTPMFTTKERLSMIEREMDRDVRPYLSHNQEVIVTSYEGLTVDFMKSVRSSFCIRGIRGAKSFEEERELAIVNKELYDDSPQSESLSQAYFIVSNPQLIHVSSSLARSICHLENKDVSLLRYVSADVAIKMIEKHNRQEPKCY